MIWENVESLSRLARIVPYLFIIFGFLVALGGQYVQSFINDRIDDLKIQQKLVPPKLTAEAYMASEKQVRIVITAENDTPTRVNWFFVTKNNRVVSAVRTEMVELYPTPATSRWNHTQPLNLEQILDGYIELRMNYVSIYASQFGNPTNLSGSITREYQLVGGALQLNDCQKIST